MLAHRGSMGVLAAIAAGLAVSAGVVALAGAIRGERPTTTRLVAEDASAPLARIAIHYAPASDKGAMPVWRDLFRALPPSVNVDVEVSEAPDYDRLIGKLESLHVPHLERFHRVVVGAPITTWSRDRYAALVDADGHGSILAPPRVQTAFQKRAGDGESPAAISNALYGVAPHVSRIVFEGGDLAATPDLIFADANLQRRNEATTNANREAIEDELHTRFAQRIVWLGEQSGDVPRHHIMMYMMPIDDYTVAVGDERAGLALLANEPDAGLELEDPVAEAGRFDRAAAILVAQGFKVVRVPALVLKGAGSFVTYTNALFDRRGDQKIVYLPTYALPSLDDAATAFWQGQGFEVHPVDVSNIYQMNGSLGCLVNVTRRAARP
jgi:hypothetical protein